MNLRIGPANDDRSQDFIHNNVKFKFKAYDPYGFIKVTCLTSNWNLPGEFTSLDQAKKAAIIYANNYQPRKKNI